jgi:mannose-6-phosphate isomerase-like protein (cupin superfamily)
MTRASKISLEGALTVVSGPNPPTADGFRSTRVQVLHWQVTDASSDPGPHSHSASDEVYVVLDGPIDVAVDGERIRVGPAEALVVGAGVIHSLIAVQYPARGLTIRGPAIPDKQVESPIRSAPAG